MKKPWLWGIYFLPFNFKLFNVFLLLFVCVCVVSAAKVLKKNVVATSSLIFESYVVIFFPPFFVLIAGHWTLHVHCTAIWATNLLITRGFQSDVRTPTITLFEQFFLGFFSLFYKLLIAIGILFIKVLFEKKNYIVLFFSGFYADLKLTFFCRHFFVEITAGLATVISSFWRVSWSTNVWLCCWNFSTSPEFFVGLYMCVGKQKRNTH